MTTFSGGDSTCAIEALELIDELRSLNDMRAIAQRLSTAIAGFGFHAFLMTRLPARTERIDSHILLMSWPRDWLSRYGRLGYYAHDPVAQGCFSTLKPFIWSKADWKGCDPDSARRVMREAMDYNLNDGVMVPMHDLSGNQASLSMAATRLDLPPNALAAIHLVGLYALASADECPVKRPLLSERQRDILSWLAQGCTIPEIGEALGISHHTATTHVRNAKLKLDARTVTETVVKAMRRREIRL